jgi:hypothetical protein
MIDEPDAPSEAVEPPQETPLSQPLPPPMDGNGKSEAISDQVRKARDVIPVGDRGIAPQTYAQWIDIAKDVCKAYLMLPPHLHNNAPVMAGILEIAARFNLSPFLLGSKTYVQGGRLCFESQAFGAILYASKLLLGRLRFEFQGEGDDMTCTVSGRFRDDPDVVYSATSPPLKQIHPGTTQKDGKTFVKGSQLYEKDPEQQMAYFAQRRWARRHAPDIVMGMYTPEEIDEIDDYRAGRGDPLSVDRLGRLETGEGWGEGAHLDADLAKIAPEELLQQVDWPETEVSGEPEAPSGTERSTSHHRQPARRRKAGARGRTSSASKTPPRGSKGRGRPTSRPAVQTVVKRAELPPRRWLDYVRKAGTWISAAVDPDKADEQWESERQERDSLHVPMGERSRLRAILDRKVAQLRKAKEQV